MQLRSDFESVCVVGAGDGHPAIDMEAFAQLQRWMQLDKILVRRAHSSVKKPID
jgi:hypothetical protein